MVGSVDNKLKESNSEAFSGADKKPKTVKLNNFLALIRKRKKNSVLQHFAALIRNQKSNYPALCGVDKKSKRNNFAAIWGVDKNFKKKAAEISSVDKN